MSILQQESGILLFCIVHFIVLNITTSIPLFHVLKCMVDVDERNSGFLFSDRHDDMLIAFLVDLATLT